MPFITELIDARDAPIDQAVRATPRQAGIDDRGQADGDVLGLRFRNLQLRLQVRRLRDLAERRTGGNLLAFLNLRQRRRQGFQHAVESGADFELVHLSLLEIVLALKLIHFYPGRGKLRLVGLRVDFEPLAFDLVLFAQLLRFGGGNFRVDIGDQPILGQLGIAIRLQLGVLIVGLHFRGLGLHIEQALLQRDLQVVVIRLGGFQGVLRAQKQGYPVPGWS